MTNQITDTKLLENQILGNQIAGTSHSLWMTPYPDQYWP